VSALRPASDVELRRLAAGCLLASFPGDRAPSWVWREVDGGLGGICLYGSNRGADTAAIAAALHEVRPDVVVALDEEGGDVTRLEATVGSSVPGNAALGAVDDPSLTRDVAAALGHVLHDAGVDLDLAPCADVNSDTANPVIGVRSFGADPDLVARHTVAFVAGLQAAGVAACAKHFPGHGAVAVDSHVAMPTVDAPADVLRHRELVPFRAAVAAGVAAVMPGHLLVPALDPAAPATASRPIVTDLLRGELGFRGLVVTDALDMGGAGGPDVIPRSVTRALAAGADLCCLGPDNDADLVEACVAAVVAAIEAGTLAAERVADAAARVAALRGSLAVVPDGRDPDAWLRVAATGAAAARRAMRIDGAPPVPLRGAHVVELDRPANIAAGNVPWGIAGALAALDPSTSTSRVAEGDDAAVAGALAAATGRPLVVVVRDPQRRPAQAAALQTLLAARPDAVVVDMGWPSGGAEALGAAHITTFGASRASGAAVAGLLAGERAASTPVAAVSEGRTSRG
jgi:beta-N-acetylhexosaminidase